MLQLLTTLGQSYDYSYSTSSSTGNSGALAVVFAIIGIISLAILIPSIIGMWKVYAKAGKPGWASIVPFYNVYVLLEIVGRPTSWIGLYIAGFVLSLIPFVGFLISIGLLALMVIIYIDLAKSFGKDTGFGVLTVFFPFIMIPILGFGDAKYHGPSVAAAGHAYTGNEPAYPAPVMPTGGQPVYPTPATPVSPVAPSAPVQPTYPQPQPQQPQEQQPHQQDVDQNNQNNQAPQA